MTKRVTIRTDSTAPPARATASPSAAPSKEHGERDGGRQTILTRCTAA